MDRSQPVSIPPELAALAASLLANLARAAWEIRLTFAALGADLAPPALAVPMAEAVARPAFWLAVLYGAGLFYWPALALIRGRAWLRPTADLTRGSIAKGELDA